MRLSDKQIDRFTGPASKATSHPRANFSQCKETIFAGMGSPDAQPLSVMASGSIVTDCTIAPGIFVVVSQLPFHWFGALNDVVPPGVPHGMVLAVSFDGRAHDPVGGAHVHTSQTAGATRSARPW